MNKLIRVFVYGNTRQGRPSHEAFLQKGAAFIAHASVNNLRLYQVWANCPCAVEEQGDAAVVEGELYDCAPDALLYLDNLLHCDNGARKYVVAYFKIGESLRTATAWMHYRINALPISATPVKSVFECQSRFYPGVMV